MAADSRRSDANRSSGSRPAPFVGPEPVGQQDPAVDDGSVPELGQGPGEAVRTVEIQDPAEQRAWRSPVRAAGRPQAALLDDRADAASRVRLEPAQRGRRGSTDHDQLRAAIAHDPGDVRQGRPQRPQGRVGEGRAPDRPNRRGAGPVARGEDDIERRIEVDRQAPAFAQVGHANSGLLGEPARHLVVAAERRHRPEDAGIGDRERVGGVGVVGDGLARWTRGDLHEVAQVGRPGEGQGARPEDDEAAADRAIGRGGPPAGLGRGRPSAGLGRLAGFGRSGGGVESERAPQAIAKRHVRRRFGDEPDVVRPGRQELPAVVFGQRRAGSRQRRLAWSRPAGRRVEDQDGDWPHQPSLEPALG